MGLGDELDQVFVSSVVAGEEDDLIYLIVLISIGSSFFGQLELHSDDWLDRVLDTRLIELERPIHIARIRDGNSGLTEFLGPFDESLRISECLLERIVSMSMQVDE